MIEPSSHLNKHSIAFRLRPTGYGLVEILLDVDAYRAVNILEGTSFNSRKIHLTEEEPLIEKAKEILLHLAQKGERDLGNRSGTR